jgi:beta-N-acetylhexosaminidase
MRDVNEHYPVGGLILYAWNIDNEAQLSTLIAQIRSLNGQPLLCIDEEGGRVSRIANNPNFNVKKYESMSAIGATGDPNNAYECGNTIGTYLHRYGFDIDFAPVADVNTNPENVIIGPRAFSDDPAVAAPMVTHYLQGLKDAGVTGCIKHFPGHGDTKADTHFGYASTQKTWAEMMDCEMVTFKAGIQWGCQLIMTAHIGAPNVTGSDVPSTMSPIILQDKLRGELGYQNLIITDGIHRARRAMHSRHTDSVSPCLAKISARVLFREPAYRRIAPSPTLPNRFSPPIAIARRPVRSIPSYASAEATSYMWASLASPLGPKPSE